MDFRVLIEKYMTADSDFEQKVIILLLAQQNAYLVDRKNLLYDK